MKSLSKNIFNPTRFLLVLAGLLFATGAQAWTDGNPLPSGTRSKAQHVYELKQAIDGKYTDPACIAAAGGTLAVWDWENPPSGNVQAGFPTGSVTAWQNTRIKSSHFVAMRAAVRNLYALTSTAPFCTTAPSVCNTNTTIQNTPLEAGHINDLRAALDNPLLCVSGGSVCGNGGAPEAGEQCDDGGTINGDGCSSTCQCEYAWTNDGCGDAPCPANKRHQSAIDPDGTGACTASTQCVVDPACGVTCNIFPGTMTLCSAGECCVPDPVNGLPYEICTATCPTCSDGIQNQDETGIDCGGSICLPCVTEGALSLESTHFSSHGVYGNWRNINTNQNYYLEVPDGSGGTSMTVPFGDYEWLGGDVMTEVGCPVPSDPPDVSPAVGTTQTIDGATPGFSASVGCH